MGFFRRNKNNIINTTVKIMRSDEIECDNRFENFDELIDKSIYEIAYEQFEKGCKFYELRWIDESRINGIIREYKIKKKHYKKNGIDFEYGPVLLGSGTIEVDEHDRIIIHTSERGTHRKLGYIKKQDWDNFKKDFYERYVCIMFVGGEEKTGDKNEYCYTTRWKTFVVFTKYKDEK